MTTQETEPSGDFLTRKEFANISEKVNAGAIGSALLRVPIFQPVDKLAKRGKLAAPIFYKSGSTEIGIDYNLSQKHLNALTVMFESNEKRLHSGGRLVINASLYSLAKKMGYKNSEGPSALKSLIDDMVSVVMTIKMSDNKKRVFHLIDSYEEDLVDGGHVFNLSPEFMRYFAYDFAVQIEKERASSLVKHSNSAVQAIVRYFVTHSSKLKNGVFLDTICAHYGRDKTRDMKSKFKAKIRENLDFLAGYNIYYDLESDKLFYTPSAEIAQIFAPVETPNAKLLEVYRRFTELERTEIPYSSVFGDRTGPIMVEGVVVADKVELTLQDGDLRFFNIEFSIDKEDKVNVLEKIYKVLTTGEFNNE